MDESRRDFLKKLGIAALAMGGGSLPLFRDAVSIASGAHSGAGTTTTGKQLAMIIDIEKCFDERVRRACVEACKREHNIPTIDDPKEEIKWIWSATYEEAFPDQTHPHMSRRLEGKPVLVFCNHCSTPGCTKVCPTQATWKRESDGIVMMDMHRCIGCRYCMAACPYGARSFNFREPRPYIKDGPQTLYPTRTKGVVEKCTFCASRLRDGKEPACVEAANQIPGGRDALIFGDVNDPESRASQILRDENTIVRKVTAGTGPNIYYIV
jgi:Fe-S-cluster-containing dehydrogenase component